VGVGQDGVTPEPDAGTITVTLANSRRVGGRACQPDDVVTLPADEARDLLSQGLARRA
jgi:hypothetical protein